MLTALLLQAAPSWPSTVGEAPPLRMSPARRWDSSYAPELQAACTPVPTSSVRGAQSVGSSGGGASRARGEPLQVPSSFLLTLRTRAWLPSSCGTLLPPHRLYVQSARYVRTAYVKCDSTG